MGARSTTAISPGGDASVCVGFAVSAAEEYSLSARGTSGSPGAAGQLHRETHGKRQEQHATAGDQDGPAREDASRRIGAAVRAGFKAHGKTGRSVNGVAADKRTAETDGGARKGSEWERGSAAGAGGDGEKD